MTKKFATTVDVEIGQRIRSIRVASGISQEKLGEALGITFQQVQKYEKGMNRVSGSRLIDVASALGVSVSRLVGEEGGAVAPGEVIVSDPATKCIVDVCRRLGPSARNQLLEIAQTFRPARATRVVEAAE